LNYWYQGKDILNERLGTFIIPAQSYEASVALPEEAVTRKGSPLYDLLSKNVRLNSPVLYYELTDQSYIKDDKQTDIMKPWGLQDSDPRCTKLASPDWSRVLEIIHYCLPIEERSSNIGIVEKLVDTTHPAFALATGQSSLQRYAATEDGSKTRPTDSDSQNKFNPDWDHGTHIAGLVGAHSHLHYVFGVQPESTIWGIKPGDFSKALEVDPNEKDLSEVHVFNISLGEKDLTDPQNRGIGIDAAGQLKALIDQNIYLDKLFVIAAGDVKQQVQEGSLATRSFRQNVIVVGASNLNDPPGFSEHSSYGWEYVDIVAPGDDIVSALYGGGYGKATGTSQATALVSGTAALLAGVEPNWEPWKIKQRILSSADLWTDGPNSANVRTGMLNVKAAVLNRTEAVLRFWAPSAPSDSRSIRPNGNTTVSVADCSGRIQYAGVKGALKVLIPGEGTKDIPLKNIRRFHRDPETKNFTILYTRDNRSDQTVKLENRIGLERLTNIEGINLRGVTQFVFTPSNGCEAKTTIDLKDLSELINGFY